MLLLAQSSFAEGTSLGEDATFAANLMLQRSVTDCIHKIENVKGATASINDIRVVDKDAGKYELTLFLIQGGDMALGHVELQLERKARQLPWGPSYFYTCSEKTN